MRRGTTAVYKYFEQNEQKAFWGTKILPDEVRNKT